MDDCIALSAWLETPASKFELNQKLDTVVHILVVSYETCYYLRSRSGDRLT